MLFPGVERLNFRRWMQKMKSFVAIHMWISRSCESSQIKMQMFRKHRFRLKTNNKVIWKVCKHLKFCLISLVRKSMQKWIVSHCWIKTFLCSAKFSDKLSQGFWEQFFSGFVFPILLSVELVQLFYLKFFVKNEIHHKNNFYKLFWKQFFLKVQSKII